MQHRDRRLPSTFLVPQNGYPVVGTTWMYITIFLVNMDWLCRSPGGVWLVAQRWAIYVGDSSLGGQHL